MLKSWALLALGIETSVFRMEQLDTPCIEWSGARSDLGYGVVGRRKLYAHRLAYEAVHGPIPPGQVVRHRCDNPPCVNVDHLVLGTQADNVQDAAERNRLPHGEQHHASKLTSVEIEEIRAAYEVGVKQKALSLAYGVGQPAISRIVNGKRRAKESV